MRAFNRDAILILLRQCIVTVTFNKKNGDKRVMDCTLQSEFLPPPKPTTDVYLFEEKAVNENVVNVWDVEADGWRSFVLANVTNVETGIYPRPIPAVGINEIDA